MVENKSRDEFIEDNLRLVHSLCKRFVGRGIEYDDLYQAGCVGLVKAVDAFDKTRGLCFSTYAVPVILGEVRRLFRDGGSVKISRSVKELAMKIAREKEKMEFELGREPTVGELAQRMDVSVEEVTESFCALQPTVSLTYEDDDGVNEFDLPTQSVEEELSDKLLLDEAFRGLDDIEQRIIRYRYYDYLTQSQTAKKLSMTQVQVSRAEKKILKKLRGIIDVSA
ncbi:MAG: sigma-70 family RNA polymerase sigma factor [Clostridia bacterium]|nr:sigma-70 family RNA polymerase sigma factor [Clostridia bacterium]